MRNKLFLVLLFVSFVAVVNAQTKFHVNPGFILSQIDGDGIGGYTKLGYSLGAGFRFDKTDKYFTDFSTRINRKGGWSSPYTVSLHYVEVDYSWNYTFYQNFYAGFGVAGGALLFYRDVSYVPTNLPIERYDLFPLVNIGARLNDNILLQVRLTRSIIPITGLSRSVPNWFNRSILGELVIELR